MESPLGYNITVNTVSSAARGYDGMWALALAMHQAEGVLSRRLDTYQYGDEEYARVIGEGILGTDFAGMTVGNSTLHPPPPSLSLSPVCLIHTSSRITIVCSHVSNARAGSANTRSRL